MNEEYKIKLDLNLQNITKFKEKDAYILIKTIGGSRLGDEHLKFNSYGIITFDESDIHKTNPTVTSIDNFNRLKVNCLIFDVLYNRQNDGYFNKLFIYSDAAHDEYYNYVLYNSETKHQIHHFLLDKELDILLQSLTRDFNTMYNADIITFYLEKSKAIKKHKNHDYSVKISSINDWKKMINAHNTKYLKYERKTYENDMC